MALYIPHSILHLARLLYVRPETFGPYCVSNNNRADNYKQHFAFKCLKFRQYLWVKFASIYRLPKRTKTITIKIIYFSYVTRLRADSDSHVQLYYKDITNEQNQDKAQNEIKTSELN